MDSQNNQDQKTDSPAPQNTETAASNQPTGLESPATTQPIVDASATPTIPADAPIIQPQPAQSQTVAQPINSNLGAAYTAPTAPVPAPTAPNNQPKVGAGHVVLQWMTYAFWLWAAWALISLIVSVLIQAIVPGSNTGEFSLYAFAATLVLLPVASTCDVIYSKTEEQHKKGAATAVMLIHAVIFALSAVGALISAVFALITFAVSSGATETILTWFVASIIATVIFGALFTRTVFGVKIPHFRKGLVIGMSIIAICFTIAAFVGPVATMAKTKDDKLVRNNITDVAQGVDDYVNKNAKLPESLDDISVNSDAKELIERQLVTYTPGSITQPTTSLSSTYKYSTYSNSSSTKYNFTLCTTYKADYNTDRSDYSSSYYTDSDGATNASSFYLYGNKKGKQCYKLYSTSSNSTADIYQ